MNYEIATSYRVSGSGSKLPIFRNRPENAAVVKTATHNGHTALLEMDFGKTIDDIADAEGCSTATVRNILALAISSMNEAGYVIIAQNEHRGIGHTLKAVRKLYRVSFEDRKLVLKPKKRSRK